MVQKLVGEMTAIPLHWPRAASSSGPALHRAPTRSLEYSSATSILGRLMDGAADLQKPRTPTIDTDAADSKQQVSTPDADYLQLTLCAEEYLKLVSAPATSTIGGAELYLIDSSRMRHQQAAWEKFVGAANLTHKQQVELETLVQSLGRAVEAADTDAVLAVQSSLANVDRTIALPLLSNNLILDAWIDFLHSKRQYFAIVRLFQSRMHIGVRVNEFSLSRKSACKVLLACAVEGDIASSMMALRETSWSALVNAPVDGDVASAVVSSGVPSSVSRLPSWCPAYYSSDAAAMAVGINTRSSFDTDGPDSLLVASAEGFGVDVNATSTVAPLVATSTSPVVVHSRPPPVLLRPIPFRAPLSSFSSLLGSSLLQNGATSTVQNAAAGMSTRARHKPAPVSVTPPPMTATITAAAEPTPITPLPIFDLWTELTLDSRLMELAVLTAIRSSARSSTASFRAASSAIASAAAAHPLSSNPELNLSIHEHAAALFGRSSSHSTLTKRSTPIPLDFMEELEPDAADDEFDVEAYRREADETNEPKSVFAVINAPKSQCPLAFQLWSLMLQQSVPLQHSNTFVQLMSQLQSNLPTLPSSTSSVLLTTLSNELQHARSKNGALQHKFLHTDVEAFLTTQLQVYSDMSKQPESNGDEIWECISVLRSMHTESIQPSVESVASIYRSILFGSESSFGRSKLLQDLQVVCEDLQLDVDAVINAAVDEAQVQ